MSDTSRKVDDVLVHLYNNFDPILPAKPGQYVDFSEVRGGTVFVRQICEELDLTRDGYIRALFTGHQGCGKSSELKHLETELIKEENRLSNSRYFPIYIDALDYVDLFDASVAEILLAIVAEIAATLKEREEIELRDSAFEKRWRQIQSLLTGAEMEKIEIPLWAAKLSISLKKTSDRIRKQVRDSLEPQMTGIIDEINVVLDKARIALRSKAPKPGETYYKDIVLILDNLEKIRRVAGEENEEKSQRALFIEGASKFTALNVHTIYTVHLTLVRSIGAELTMTYGKDAYVLPNVKTEERGSHKKWDKGRDRLKEMLKCRVSPYTLEHAFAPDALEFLLDYCGGHIRQLMTFVRNATTNTRQHPLSFAAVEDAVLESATTFSSSIRIHQWKLLAQLERSPTQEWDNHSQDERQLLDLLSVMEYRNGSENPNRFQRSAFWYAVHPIVRELEPFQNALKQLDAVPNRSSTGD